MNLVSRLALYGCLIFVCCAPAQADVPLASRDADRQAKSAAPTAGEAFVYVYRVEDKNDAPLAVTLNGRETYGLAPRTYTLWKVQPGRNEVAVERSASSLPLQCEGGRVYYVELARTGAGVPTLRTVSFATGRIEVHRGQLVAQTPAPSPPARAQTAAPSAARAAVTPPPASATRGALMLKFGSYSVGEESQQILGAARRFGSASSVLALEGEYFWRPDLSLGLEFVRFSNEFTGGGVGKAQTTATLFNIKRYFLPDSAWQPYIGAGLGAGVVDFSGAITGSTSGFALQAVGGLQWRRGPFALRGEYKYLGAKTKDDAGEEVNVSGSGFFLGVGFLF